MDDETMMPESNAWTQKMSSLFFKKVSHIENLPLLKNIFPQHPEQYINQDDLTGFRKVQTLALHATKEVAKQLKPGWTETQTARILDGFLKDAGVHHFFHKSFVWFGDRTRFRGVKNYHDYAPTSRRMREKDVFILDVAPILDGYIADVGYSGSLVENKEFEEAMHFLQELRGTIPTLCRSLANGSQLVGALAESIAKAGYENIHETYPFGVLGHRIHKTPSFTETPLSILNFGSASYLSYFGRGVFGQLLNRHHEGDLVGLWAIEPHIATSSWGVKFEEILVITKTEAYWLSDEMHAFYRGQSL